MRVLPPVCEFEFVFKGERLSVREGRYQKTKAPSLTVYGPHGEPFATLTANLPEAGLPEPGCYYIKTWSENRDITNVLLHAANPRFEDTGRRIPTGFVEVHVWRYLG